MLHPLTKACLFGADQSNVQVGQVLIMVFWENGWRFQVSFRDYPGLLLNVTAAPSSNTIPPLSPLYSPSLLYVVHVAWALYLEDIKINPFLRRRKTFGDELPMVEFQSLCQTTGRTFPGYLRVIWGKILPPMSNSEAVSRQAGGCAGGWLLAVKGIYLTGLEYKGAVEQGPRCWVLKFIAEFA